MPTNRTLYTDSNPLQQVPFETKVKLLEEIDAYARSRDPRVRQVSVSLGGEWQAVQILRADGHRVGDIRPPVRLNVSVTVVQGDRLKSGPNGAGGRRCDEMYIDAPSRKVQNGRYWSRARDV